jgi:hypothetical protein
MNVATALMTSYRARPASSRWAMMSGMGLIFILTAAMRWSEHMAAPTWLPWMLVSYVEFFTGAFVFGPSLLLSTDAKQLRLPGLQRHLVLGISLEALLWIAIPSLILSIYHGQLMRIMAVDMLSLIAGLAFALIPRAIAIAALLAPSALSLMHIGLRYPENMTLSECLGITAALIALCAICWIQQLRANNPDSANFTTPIAMHMRSIHRGGWNDWGDGSASIERLSRAHGRSQYATASVCGSGPGDPIRSLRVGLGGWLMPRNMARTLVRCSYIVLPIVVLILLLDLRFPNQLRDLGHASTFYGLAWLAGFGSAFTGLMTVSLVQQRWSGTSAELPLLALLPGLGQGPSLVKRLLRACLLPTLYTQCILTAALFCIAYVYHAGAADLAMALLAQIDGLLFAPAFVLAVIGGRPMPAWVVGLFAGSSFSMIGISTGIGAAAAANTVNWTMSASIFGGWLILLAFLCWLGWRGWRGLARRPHPFLPI